MTNTSLPPQTPAFQPSIQQLDLRPRTLWRDAWTRLTRRRSVMICLGIVVVYVLIALSTFLPFYEYRDANGQPHGAVVDPVSAKEYQPPRWDWRHPSVWLGTDIMRQSVFWRTLYGTRIALTIAIGASILTITIGMVLGVLAGYFPGLVDDAITWLFSTVSSVPWILLVLALAYVLRDRVNPEAEVILALGLTDWVGLCRLIRGETIKLRDRDYVTAARAIGLGHKRVIFRHILPNVFHLVIIQFSIGAIGYVQAEVVLAFLGLGITDKPSWGRMIDDAKLELLRGVWWQVTAATVAIFILCLALNILGDALRDALDPRLRGAE